MRQSEIITRLTCDWCLYLKAATEATSAFTGALQAGRRMPQREYRTIDLCTEHAETVRVIAEIFRSGERRTPRTVDEESTVTELQCQGCGFIPTGPTTAAMRNNLSGHLRKVHRLSLRTPKKCPDCAVRTDHPSAMGRHRYAAHGHDSLADLQAAVVEQVKTQTVRRRPGGGSTKERK